MFRKLIAEFWADESGAVIAAEYLMLGTIVAAGSTTGLVAMRDAMVSEYQEFGESVKDIRRNYGPAMPKKQQANPMTTTYDYLPIVADGTLGEPPAPQAQPAYQSLYAGVSP